MRRVVRALAAAGSLGLAVVGGLETLRAFPPAPSAAAPRNGLDDALRIAAAARRSYAAVQDYTCTLIKRERMDGQLTPDNIISMKVKTRPFSVYLTWHEPKSFTGQEVCYVQGKNDGKMRVKGAGLLGAIGFVSLDPNDARAKQTSKNSITEAGLGNALERVAQGWENEKRLGRSVVVRLGEYEYNQRRCVRTETINPTRQAEHVCHRSVVYFDREHWLPIRVELYDWPTRQGQPGELLEVYSFVNLKLNVGLTDDMFRR